MTAAEEREGEGVEHPFLQTVNPILGKTMLRGRNECARGKKPDGGGDDGGGKSAGSARKGGCILMGLPTAARRREREWGWREGRS